MKFVILKNEPETASRRVWQGGAYIIVPADAMEQTEPWGLDIAGEVEWQQKPGKAAKAINKPDQPSPED